MGRSGRPLRASDRLQLGITDTRDCFVRTDWAGIGKDNCECCATNTAGKARADCSRQVHQPTGVVWFLEKLSQVKATGGCLAHSAQPLSSCILHDRSRYRC